jgi:hypothetical protein
VKDEIEIYVRHSSAGTFLNFYVPNQIKEQFITAIRRGGLEGDDASVTVELPVLPEWITDEKVRAKVAKLNEPVHLRIPVTSLNVTFSE